MLHVTVRDNGPDLTAGGDGYRRDSGGVGLRNTRERLKGLYGSNQRLSLKSLPEGGVLAHVSLPFHTSSHYVVAAVDED